MIDKLSPKQCVAWYLVHSFLYYHCDSPVIADDLFDAICEKIKNNWGVASEHKHAYLIDYEALQAGTGFYLLLEDYPAIVKSVAYRIMDGDKDFMEASGAN